MNKRSVLAILDFITSAILALQAGQGWRFFKKEFRKQVWRPIVKPLLAKQDWTWVPDALALLALIRVLVNQFMDDEDFRNTAHADSLVALRSQFGGKR